jgi:N-acetylneuraminic acid mutarotase
MRPHYFLPLVLILAHPCFAADPAPAPALPSAPAGQGGAPLRIEWREGPEYPMGIQDSALAVVDGVIVSAGGFTRHPKDVVKHYPDAFAGQPLMNGAASGFTALTFIFDPREAHAKWKRIANIPGPARQASASAVVGGDFYAIGGFNYTKPFTYRDTYRLRREGDAWRWSKLACELPWPVCESAAVVIHGKIYLVGGADFHPPAGEKDPDFISEESRSGQPVGRALLVLDTRDPAAGWKRLADLPGSPRFDVCAAGAGGKIYVLGGVHRATTAGKTGYYNVTDAWMYDPATGVWTAIGDMPAGANRRAVTFADRYILLLGGYKYQFTWKAGAAPKDVYSEAEKKMAMAELMEDAVLVFDTQTHRISRADHLLDPASFPMAGIDGATIYTLGGEGGRRLWHPATFQIGTITLQDAALR